MWQSLSVRDVQIYRRIFHCVRICVSHWWLMWNHQAIRSDWTTYQVPRSAIDEGNVLYFTDNPLPWSSISWPWIFNKFYDFRASCQASTERWWSYIRGSFQYGCIQKVAFVYNLFLEVSLLCFLPFASELPDDTKGMFKPKKSAAANMSMQVCISNAMSFTRCKGTVLAWFLLENDKLHWGLVLHSKV